MTADSLTSTDRAIEFRYVDVIDFLRSHALLGMTVQQRAQSLVELGLIAQPDPAVAMGEAFNAALRDALTFSPLIRNAHWERTIAALTGTAIRIIDHADASLGGTCCPACAYRVFTDREDAFHGICPVCRWQNDGTSGETHSGCNRVTMNAYISSSDFASRAQAGALLYLRAEPLPAPAPAVPAQDSPQA
ncbi:MAG: CPCC family cysteine-rich protein [Stenotrophomonas sp.]